ncbi:MAG: hypothetical protein WCJ92_02190 [Alphaproteobacteria bacterium]
MLKKSKIISLAALLFCSNQYFSSEAERAASGEHAKQVSSHRGRGLGEGAYDSMRYAHSDSQDKNQEQAASGEHAKQVSSHRGRELGSHERDAEFPTLHVAPKYKNSLNEKQFTELSQNSSIYSVFPQYAVFEEKVYSVVFPKGLTDQVPNVKLLGKISLDSVLKFGDNDTLIYYIEEQDEDGKEVEVLKVERKIPNSTESMPLKEMYGRIITPQELGMRQASH